MFRKTSYREISRTRQQVIELGPTPTEESCIQLKEFNDRDDRRAMIIECTAYLNQLQRMAPVPAGCELVIMQNHHDFGTYFEAAILFDEGIEAAQDYAYSIESNLPDHWDNEAIEELMHKEHPFYYTPFKLAKTA